MRLLGGMICMLRKYYAFKFWLFVTLITLVCGMVSFLFLVEGPSKAPARADLEFHSGTICSVSGEATNMRIELCNDENFYRFRPSDAAMGDNLDLFRVGAQVEILAERESEIQNRVFELRLPREGVLFGYEEFKRRYESGAFWGGIVSIFIFLMGATALLMKTTGWNIRKIPSVRHAYN